MTRQQDFMRIALKHVHAVKENQGIDANVYGGLCHKLPILVRTNGLCQALAFVADKSRNEKRGSAYDALLGNVSELLGETKDGLLAKVRDASTTEYVFFTRRLLEAWVFYKRFAVSVLDVQDASATEDGD